MPLAVAGQVPELIHFPSRSLSIKRQGRLQERTSAAGFVAGAGGTMRESARLMPLLCAVGAAPS